MKTLVVISVLVALVASKPSGIGLGAHLVAPIAYSSPVVAVSPVVVNAISSQYHAQDSLGQYTYGYASPLSSKAESKTIDGITRGGYTYLDAEGKVQAASYVADPVNGFRIAATNIPVGPTQNIAPIELAPKQVLDSPEVAAAKAAHFAAIEEAKARVAAANLVDSAQIEAKIAPIPTVPLVSLSIPTVGTVKTESKAEKVEPVSVDKEQVETVAAENPSKDSVEIKAAKIETAPPALSYAYTTNIIGAPVQSALIASAPQILIPNAISTYNTIAAPAAGIQLIGQIPVAPGTTSEVVVESKSAKLSETKTDDQKGVSVVKTAEIPAPVVNYVASGWAPFYLTNKK